MTSVHTLPDITATPAWDALRRHHDQIGDTHLRQFFDDDPDRGRELTVSVGDLYIDYSKHRVTRETLRLLVDLAPRRTSGRGALRGWPSAPDRPRAAASLA